jgi:hypothetical protein
VNTLIHVDKSPADKEDRALTGRHFVQPQRQACQHGGMINIPHPVNNEFIPASREKSNHSAFSGVTSRGNLRRQNSKNKAAAESGLRFSRLLYRSLQCKTGTRDSLQNLPGCPFNDVRAVLCVV